MTETDSDYLDINHCKGNGHHSKKQSPIKQNGVRPTKKNLEELLQDNDIDDNALPLETTRTDAESSWCEMTTENGYEPR